MHACMYVFNALHVCIVMYCHVMSCYVCVYTNYNMSRYHFYISSPTGSGSLDAM